MKKRELIRYVCSGGLRMYDDECSIRWHNMPDDERADWLVFFDMCRDEPTQHTEAVIAAIMAGLCPRKMVVQDVPTPSFRGEPEPVKEKVWLFRTGPAFDGKAGTVLDWVAEPKHLLGNFSYDGRGPWFCVPVEVDEDRRTQWMRRRAASVHAFKHPAHAWAFLLSLL